MPAADSDVRRGGAESRAADMAEAMIGAARSAFACIDIDADLAAPQERARRAAPMARKIAEAA